MFAKTFLVTGVVWPYLFFPKITMRAFIVFSFSMEFCHGTTTIVLLSAISTFCQICHHFRITVKVFLYLINFVSLFTFKSTCLFPPHGLHLPTLLIFGRVAVTKCDFKLLLLLKPIIDTSQNNFLWSSSKARITWGSFNWLFRYLNIG